MSSERLAELADICEARALTADELEEAYVLSVGADTIPSLERYLAEVAEGEDIR